MDDRFTNATAVTSDLVGCCPNVKSTWHGLGDKEQAPRCSNTGFPKVLCLFIQQMFIEGLLCPLVSGG